MTTLTRHHLNRIIFILSLVGVAIAIYVLQSWLRQSPIVCLTNGCETVRKSPASYIYGIPVPAVGLAGYSIIALMAFLRTTSKNPLYVRIMLGMATFGVLFVSWFTYTEIVVIRGICMWCAISGINMVAILLLTFKSYRLEESV